MTLITVIGCCTAYFEEPDFWSKTDFHYSRGRHTTDSRGLRYQRGRAIKVVEDRDFTMRSSWQIKHNTRSDDYFGLLERRFSSSSKSHDIGLLLDSITRCKEPSEDAEDAYWCRRGFV